jgi:hypothetical protein
VRNRNTQSEMVCAKVLSEILLAIAEKQRVSIGAYGLLFFRVSVPPMVEFFSVRREAL